MVKIKTIVFLLAIAALTSNTIYVSKTQAISTSNTDQIPPIVTQDSSTIETTQITTQETKQDTTQESTQQTTQETDNSQTQVLDYAQQQFKDVNEGNKYFIAINFLKLNNLVKGYEDSTFKPKQEINRAEAIKLLFDAITGPTAKNPKPMNFTDVKATDWFYTNIEKAWNNYVVSGYPDGLFHPEKTLNLAEAVKITLQQEGNTIPQNIDTKPYTDVQTTDWFAPYAFVAKQRTLVLESRDKGAFLGGTTMTRGAFAELIYRLLQNRKGITFARATWYGDNLAKTKTASGESYAPDEYTAAHKTLPFGTKILVTNESNGKTVQVIINDRGPYSKGIDLDLSKSAFSKIADVGDGIITVEYKTIN